MKKIYLFLPLVLILASCNISGGDSHSWDVEMSFTIPDEVREVDNSGDITVAGEVQELAWEKLKLGDTLEDASLDMRADYFDQVETTNLESFSGGYKVIETVPSLDTPVCTMQTKQLEFAAWEYPDVHFIAISNDTPFALQRFCSANGIDNLTVLSDARTREFWLRNGLLLPEYGLLTRSIMIVDENNTILYIEYANKVTSELDLMNALAFLKNLIKE